jgi:hypothetical protein
MAETERGSDIDWAETQRFAWTSVDWSEENMGTIHNGEEL